MSRIVYVNGEYVPEAEAHVSVFDRAVLFGDAVYEVSAVVRGRMVDNERHLARLERSLAGLGIPLPAPLAQIAEIQHEVIHRNELEEGALYLQVTRGVADRDFAFPSDTSPTLIMFTQARPLIDSPLAARGMRVRSAEEIRWAYRHLKTVQLLAASLAKQAALDEGYDDTWFVQDGFVTEGTSSNTYIVTSEGIIVTRHLSSDILPGITRMAVLEIAAERDLEVEERPFGLEEVYVAREAFASSSTAMVMPVVSIDDRAIGDGAPGPISTAIRARYIEKAIAGD